MLLLRLGTELYYLLIRLFSLKNEKAKKWIDGRKKSYPVNNFNRTTLFHFASYGEYEQGYPLMVKFHEKYPEKEIIISFFSPSGFEKITPPSFVKAKVYLPRDRRPELKRFFQHFNIETIFLIKYELWPNLLRVSRELEIKRFLISARFKSNHFILNPIFKGLLNELKAFE